MHTRNSNFVVQTATLTSYNTYYYGQKDLFITITFIRINS